MNYYALNKIKVKDKYPILIIDELYGAKYFSKLDLRACYHQIRVHKKDIPKTTFRTHEGHYEFIMMPFHLTNIPSSLQSLMNDLFHPYLQRFILVFFNDILVYSKTWEYHLSHLQIFLTIFETNQLRAKKTKHKFGVSKVDYLGHVIFDQRVSIDPTKIKTIREWTTPTSTQGIHGFLGLARYYLKFIHHIGSIDAPLTQLLTKEGFKWKEVA